MLDVVLNQMAPDHPWVAAHSDYFIAASAVDLARAPPNYFRVPTKDGSRLFAHGRDPFFPGWSDTIQLNYGNPALQEAMIGELTRIAGQCDGVRCDMAMLVLPDVFQRTWGITSSPFWSSAIPQVGSQHPGFVFMAEVYWDLGWTLQQQGFDYCYDKRLYDRLREGHARPVREHFLAGLNYQNRLARFLEHHDEPRAAATFDAPKHRAAAVATFLLRPSKPNVAVTAVCQSVEHKLSPSRTGRHRPLRSIQKRTDIKRLVRRFARLEPSRLFRDGIALNRFWMRQPAADRLPRIWNAARQYWGCARRPHLSWMIS